MWAWLNPLNWIKILSLIQSLWGLVVGLYAWIIEKKKALEQGKAQKEFDSLADAMAEASKIEDENARLKAKADIAKKLEDLLRRTYHY